MSNFWLYNPTVLFDKEQILEIWPKPDMELSRKLNAITRIVIALTIIGVIITRSGKILVTSIITLVALVILYKTQYEDDEKDNIKEKIMKEGFEAGDGNEGKFIKVFRDTFTNPTKKNPMMNVLMSDYKYDPKKKRAAPAYNNNIRREINKAAKPEGKLFKDLGDSLSFENTMRNFYSMPNTTIPNDQKAFAEFCFGEMTSCKEGNTDACAKVNRRIGKVFY